MLALAVASCTAFATEFDPDNQIISMTIPKSYASDTLTAEDFAIKKARDFIKNGMSFSAAYKFVNIDNGNTNINVEHFTSTNYSITYSGCELKTDWKCKVKFVFDKGDAPGDKSNTTYYKEQKKADSRVVKSELSGPFWDSIMRSFYGDGMVFSNSLSNKTELFAYVKMVRQELRKEIIKNIIIDDHDFKADKNSSIALRVTGELTYDYFLKDPIAFQRSSLSNYLDLEESNGEIIISPKHAKKYRVMTDVCSTYTNNNVWHSSTNTYFDPYMGKGTYSNVDIYDCVRTGKIKLTDENMRIIAANLFGSLVLLDSKIKVEHALIPTVQASGVDYTGEPYNNYKTEIPRSYVTKHKDYNENSLNGISGLVAQLYIPSRSIAKPETVSLFFGNPGMYLPDSERGANFKGEKTLVDVR